MRFCTFFHALRLTTVFYYYYSLLVFLQIVARSTHTSTRLSCVTPRVPRVCHSARCVALTTDCARAYPEPRTRNPPEAMTSSFPLLTGDGTLETQKLVSFLAANGADQWNKHYVVVAVMGPQSSGKSTLMNHVFGTEFTEMNHEKGRSQTTRGVWMARAEKPNSFDSTDANKGPKPILVLDLEGTDGRERGEDDTSFEKQTALFAMASADVLMVNMWCNDLGREVASGKPLLKVVFQVRT